MELKDFKIGDCISYINYSECQYVAIIKDIDVNEDAVEEVACVCYMDPTEDEQDYMWYGIKQYGISKSVELRLATEEEKEYLLNMIESDGKFYYPEKNEVSSLSHQAKTYKLKRTFKMSCYYEDIIEVEANSLEDALDRAKVKNERSIYDFMDVIDEPICVDWSDIEELEISSDEDEKNYRKIKF